MDTVRQFLRTTTGWSMVFAFVGGIGVFLPWAWWSWSVTIGLTRWYGGAIGLSFLFLLLYLLATSTLQPIPAWRPIVTFTGAGIILVLFIDYAYKPGNHWWKFVGCWVTFVSTISLLVASSLELRGLLARRNQT